ncbi:hypothetical protein PAXRUDRAFT_825840 [Paxillus rubicundulus Ve08.2h10]|uniref:Uncharacterized protein n=1 Tax=Paxillus rubicundulus Ve08.2h10 TaxID=930991 RepID=A0A0D0DFM3_9AGAM|nr:hypothetical protein PAXRUDRAFT_825840 [Paxillus rubicundulus Ve08.2h10]
MFALDLAPSHPNSCDLHLYLTLVSTLGIMSSFACNVSRVESSQRVELGDYSVEQS